MGEPDRQTYTPMAKFWHWLTVALIAVQIALGWTMPDARRTVPPTDLNDLHMTVGFTLLIVVLLRFGWRLVAGVPQFEPGTPRWQGALASLLHVSLYALIVLFVLSGWANATFHHWPIHIYSVIPLPSLFPQSPYLRSFSHIHNWLVWVLLAGVAMHIAAALWHHYVLRDRTLVRMLPGHSSRPAFET